MPILRSATAVLVAITLSLPAVADNLAIEVKGVRSDKGRVYVAVHKPTENVTFPGAAGMVAGCWRVADGGPLRISFSGLEPGIYAVNAFHDENANGELDTNILGIPLEGYGFANDATGVMGPPSFLDASVEVRETGTTSTQMTLLY